VPESPLERAKAICLRVLAFHSRTEAQIRRRLEQDGLAAEADQAVAWLCRFGYLDDAAWAGARARTLLAPGRLGPRAAQRRRVAAGITEPSARAAVEEVLRGPDGALGAGEAELWLCRQLAARRARVPLDDLDPRARARLARFLLARGFGGEVVARVVRGWGDADG
jgi:regulatory protein